MNGGTIADLLRRGRRTALAGRDAELNLLRQLASDDGPVVAYVHGPVGIGKSALLAAFETWLAGENHPCIRIEAGEIEPRPEAIVAAIAGALGHPTTYTSELAAHLVATLADRPTVIMVDDVDTWRLAASWLRMELVPAMPASTRFVFAGATAPPAQWSAEYAQYFLDMWLGNLSREASDAAVAEAGLEPSVAARIWQLTGGHPLGLRMAIHAARVSTLDTVRAAGELANAIMHAIGDQELRRATEACCIVRRASRALVSAILDTPEPVPLSLLEAVEALPFATRDEEGIYIAEPVRQCVVDWMSGVEAERYMAWRSTAANWILGQLRGVSGAGRWRYMADLLHLLEEPVLRNAFFPTDAPAPPVEPARQDDFPAILALAEQRNGPDERACIEAWTRRLPHRFSVARGDDGAVLAFYAFARQDDPIAGLASLDPLFALWQQHLSAHPVDGEVLFVRQMSARGVAPLPPERVACVLDLKRNYIERWGLARIYSYATGVESDGVLMARLGFKPLEGAPSGLPTTMILDLPGADLVDWVATLVQAGGATGPGTMTNGSGDGLAFVRDRREITVDGSVVELTPLEAQVLAELIDRAPAAVGREELIERIWRRTFVGSNVVDTVIRTLRKKMGPLRDRIQTVPKLGYRYVEAPETNASTPSATRIPAA